MACKVAENSGAWSALTSGLLSFSKSNVDMAIVKDVYMLLESRYIAAEISENRGRGQREARAAAIE